MHVRLQHNSSQCVGRVFTDDYDVCLKTIIVGRRAGWCHDLGSLTSAAVGQSACPDACTGSKGLSGVFEV